MGRSECVSGDGNTGRRTKEERAVGDTETEVPSKRRNVERVVGGMEVMVDVKGDGGEVVAVCVNRKREKERD